MIIYLGRLEIETGKWGTPHLSREAYFHVPKPIFVRHRNVAGGSDEYYRDVKVKSACGVYHYGQLSNVDLTNLWYVNLCYLSGIWGAVLANHILLAI